MPTTTVNRHIATTAAAANEISLVARLYGLPVSEVSHCVTTAATPASFKNAIRKKAQSYWFSLVQPFEDSVVEFFPEEINRQRVRGKIRLPFALSLHESNHNRNHNRNRSEKSAPTNRRWSSGNCTYVTATLPLTEQLPNDEYEVGVPVTVYFVRVRRHDDFNLNLKEVADVGAGGGGADIWAQGITASVSRRGERFVTLLAQAELPQTLLDRFDVRCTEREEGVRSVVGISCLTGRSLRGASNSSDRDRDLKYLDEFLNNNFCANLARKLGTGTEIVECKLF